MKISIITVCKNPGEGIRKTVNSVISQTYRNIEQIIIDGASTDGAVEWLNKFATVNRENVNCEESLSLNHSSKGKGLKSTHDLPLTIHVVSEPDTGIYNAMNKGIELSTGEYLLFLNSGDYLKDSEVVSSIVKNIKADEAKTDVYYGEIITEDIEAGQRYKTANRLRNINKLKLFFWTIPHPTAFIKKDLLLKTDGYDETFKISGDYDFFLKAFHKQSAEFKFIPGEVSIFVNDGISSDKANNNMKKSENLRIIREYYGCLGRIVYNLWPMYAVLRFVYKIWLRFENKS